MVGDSSTAVTTFEGPMIPRYVRYYGGEVACHPYRPTGQVCQLCLQQGHRSDVCPTPTSPVWRNCSLLNPPSKHACSPKCQICGQGHLTGAKDSLQCLKTVRQRPPPHSTKTPAFSERGRNPHCRPPTSRPRWLSFEADASCSPLRSRSQSTSFPPLP
ncbi:hypothetical protein HPB49_019037 [Dermacentor silvarum]|uniref:Uncharacterized protein n=1 Tax=Dermacentor silvarum TaxID=543639 RepID=A0ACB8CM23_DERSI|nr:hypothetical protein HPB49_019037 [Dermacentor silvarum]